jgi:hypothetical protein
MPQVMHKVNILGAVNSKITDGVRCILVPLSVTLLSEAGRGQPLLSIFFTKKCFIVRAREGKSMMYIQRLCHSQSPFFSSGKHYTISFYSFLLHVYFFPRVLTDFHIKVKEKKNVHTFF